MSDEGPALTGLVDRVARAILDAHDWTDGAHIEQPDGATIIGWDALQPDWQEAYRTMARVAIEECAQEAAMFIIEGNSIHPDLRMDQLSPDAKMIAHTTCQHVAEHLRGSFDKQA